MTKEHKQKLENVISVADFIESINASLLSHRGRIQGEVTSISKNYPRAIYFTIKDTEEEALLNCIIWRSVYEQNGVDLEVGDEVIVTGTPEIYPRNGRFSLKTQTIEYAGEGALKKAYEALKEKLSKEGLFAIEKKRGLPKYPNKIGVITSKAGVVRQDFSSNLGRYGFKITTIDSRVEGKDAIHEILASIKTFAKEDIDVLVIMRGGGSWESLQPFNTESVVRAIADFKCPVLTGIGHDVDVTLAELAADVGESTPTAVAEALNESWDTLVNSIESSEAKIVGTFKNLLADVTSAIRENSNFALRSYQNDLANSNKTLSVKASRIRSFFIELERKINKARTALQSVVGGMKSSIRERKRYLQSAPLKIIRLSKNYLGTTQTSLSKIAMQIGSGQKEMFKILTNELDAVEKSIKLVNPERNLKLGYSLSYSGGKLIRSTKDVGVGDETETHLSDGKFTSEVKNVK
tara:strand:- start:15659 stop:17053 length:1395 start_codon:yes stop_codon:yes gene_type:complete